MKSILWMTAVVAIFAFFSCDPTASRQCPAFEFDVAKWADLDNLDTIRYFNPADSSELVFVKTESSKSGVNTQGGIGYKNEDDVPCYLNADYNYVLLGIEDSLGMQITFDQLEIANLPESEEDVVVYYIFYKTGINKGIASHAFLVQPHELVKNGGQEWVDELTVDGATYTDLVKSSRDTFMIESENPKFDFWQAYGVRQAGVVKLVNRLGEEYWLEK
ncbi:MAG TPA: hypothetical protein PKE06_12635 [Flavilitoribacter sp.]|nr:hypothetical protein [Flavilitoribacter sp.]HMQ89096.1 hypothetical protein [Flavilitoribacter sp.]